MNKVTLETPWIETIAATRAVLGAGAGLLLANRLKPSYRKVIGWTFLTAGLISTVPLMMKVYGSDHQSGDNQRRDRKGAYSGEYLKTAPSRPQP